MRDITQLPENDPSEVWGATQLADLIGVNRRTVQRWCKSGDLRSTKVGKTYVFTWGDFLDYWHKRTDEK